MKKRLISLLALTATLGLPTVAEAAPTVVVGSLTIEGGVHTFTEQIIVTPGSTLTVKDATIFLDATSSCPIRGNVTFCHPQLFVMAGGTLVTDGATFDTHNPVVINPASGGYLILSYGGVLDIDNTTFNHANTVGGEGPGPRPSRIRNSTFFESLYPISMIRGMEGIIENNEIIASRQGIHVRDADSVIVGNNISVGGNGIDVQATKVGAIAGLTTRTRVEDNYVTGGLRAFFTLNAWQSTVRNNTFDGAVLGAQIGVLTGEDIPVEEQIIFDNNILSNNETALYTYANVEGGQELPIEVVVPIRNSSIIGTTCTSALVNPPGAATVHLIMDAKNNWWGSAQGPQGNGQDCPAIVGDVLYEPWLSAPPA